MVRHVDFSSSELTGQQDGLHARSVQICTFIVRNLAQAALGPPWRLSGSSSGLPVIQNYRPQAWEPFTFRRAPLPYT